MYQTLVVKIPRFGGVKIQVPPLPETNSSPLKMDGWNMLEYYEAYFQEIKSDPPF